MEFYIDLLKVREKKSWIIIFLGIFTGLFAIFWLLNRSFENLSIRLFDIFYSLVFFVNGILIIIQGNGYSPARIFGKSFIKIDNKRLIIKENILKNEHNIPWSEITEIIYKPNNFYFKDTKKELHILNLSNLRYKKVLEIKDFIKSLAKGKGIIIQ